jgi:hypothetical protein
MGLWWVSIPQPEVAPDAVFMVIVRAMDAVGAVLRALELGAPSENDHGFAGIIPRGLEPPDAWVDRPLSQDDMAHLQAVLKRRVLN